MFQMLWHKKALILFLVVLVVLLPSAVSRPAQMMSKAVLTEITIDKVNGEYTLTGEMVKNSPGSGGAKKELEEVTGAGASVGEAINKIAAEQGREVSFAHCTQMIMGKGLEAENLADLLQYFLFRTEINNNCAVAWKEKGVGTTLEKFYKDYLRYTASSVLSEGSTQKAVFKSGVYTFPLDEASSNALGFMQSHTPKKRIVFASDVLHVLGNTACIKTSFESGVPTVNISVKIKMVLESNPMASSAALAKIETGVADKLKSDMEAVSVQIKKERADLLGFYDAFYHEHTKKFNKYFEQKSFDDFFDDIQINIKVDVSVVN